MMEAYLKDLRKMGELYGLSITDAEAALLLRHLDLLIEKNRRLNLTRITDPHDALVRHVIDSLLFLKGMPVPTLEQSFLDIGTGGGFPGIPLAIMTPLKGVLLDSVKKKAVAVDDFITDLGLDGRISTSSNRVEELAVTTNVSFTYVVARAVAELNVLIEYASPLLAQGGSLVSSKAHITDDEITNAERVARICGMAFVSRETFELPDNLGHREIIVLEKRRKPSVKLPRHVGMAKHKPL